MMIRLLRPGGYLGMDDIEFPVYLEARLSARGYQAFVSNAELLRVGANPRVFKNPEQEYSFLTGITCDIISLGEEDGEGIKH